ncbi:pyocin activator PrtN family protein [Paraburkholderia sp. HD33-4]|uniref:pyocin activator PrtN family protein n=1 Tax=Paraburkholderia sp. HD33-4 TaxID=2883242 RepID=UPI002DD428AC|nr:pyocin activator PrtN family protein [Paraburkholderia sp. HD33-4]
MNMVFLLMALHDSATVARIDVACRDYFAPLTLPTLVRKILAGEIEPPLVRMETSRKGCKDVHIKDLVKYVDTRRSGTVTKCQQLCGTGYMQIGGTVGLHFCGGAHVAKAVHHCYMPCTEWSRGLLPDFSDTEIGDLFTCGDRYPASEIRGSVIAECEGHRAYHCRGQRAVAEYSSCGRPNDRLWMRKSIAPTRDESLIFVDWRYAADGAKVPGAPHFRPEFSDAMAFAHLARTSVPLIHISRWASHTTLDVTDVRVERLRDISEADARAEGITTQDGDMNCCCVGAYRPPSIHAFAEVWESLNVMRGHGWDVTHRVRLVEFKRSSL